jgi:hypothetical protein
MMMAGVAIAGEIPVKIPFSDTSLTSYPKDWDQRIGDDPVTRFFNYYKLEWGHAEPPPDPTAPSSRRKGWGSASPQTIPPYPFTEWPYGGATALGVTRPNSVDSPLMVAIAHTKAGQALSDAHIQIYGWINAGGNISTNTCRPGCNWPSAYMYTPNTVQLDQAVLYVERLPDTVQTDHIDWGFRLSGIYGENYRYTTSYGLASYQLLGHNLVNGYDFPMVYGELYFPKVAEGLLVRVGRFISVPDIEAQLAPNNYMYSHSLSYTFDNYTNNGIQGTLAVNKNWFVQLGVTLGSDTAVWNYNKSIVNPFPNVVYPGATMKKDPGNVPSLTAGVRYQSDSGNDNVYVVADAINSGTWGYNNLQWYGVTWYHKFNDQWHFSWENYTLSQRNVLNVTDPAGIIAAGGYPFSPLASGIQWNAPGFATCSNPTVVTCTARVLASVMYLNYKFSALDNLSLRGEYYHDEEGQRTGTATRYTEVGLGWQHWFSPQVEVRPELTYYKSLNANAFNGNCNQPNNGQACTPANKSYMWLASMDLIWHF